MVCNARAFAVFIAFARASRPVRRRRWRWRRRAPEIFIRLPRGREYTFFFIGIRCVVCGNHRPRRISPHITARGKKKSIRSPLSRAWGACGRDFKSDKHCNTKMKWERFLRKSFSIPVIISLFFRRWELMDTYYRSPKSPTSSIFNIFI